MSTRTERLVGSWKVLAFRRFYIGESISNLGSTFTQFAIPVIAVVTIHAPASAVGVIVALSSLPQFTIGLVAGALVDRWRVKRTVLAYSAAMTVTLATLPVVYWVGHLSLWVLFAFVLVQGMLTTFAVSVMSFYPQLVEPDQLLDANMRLDVMDKATSVVGPGAAGWLIGLLGAPVALLADAFSFLVSLILFAATPFQETSPDLNEGSHRQLGLFRSIVSGLQSLISDTLQRAITIQQVLQVFVSSMLATVVPVYILRTLRVTTGAFGTLSAVAAIAALLGATTSTWLGRRVGVGAASLVGSMLWAIGPILLSLCGVGSSHPFVLVVILLSLSFRTLGSTVTMISTFTLRQRTIPKNLFGRIFSGQQAAAGIAAVCGGVVAGALTSVVGLRLLLIIIGVAAFTVPLNAAISPIRSAMIGRTEA